MRLLPPDIDDGLALVRRVDPKYAPAWAGLSDREQAALAMYFLPHRSAKPVLGVTRPRVVKWYCPFADQRTFPTGPRYCINVYTGCAHGCVYCYAAGYLAMDARPKAGFRRLLLKDLQDLDAFDVPPAPVHLSNSTDACQPLETRIGDTLFTLQHLGRFAHRFSTVTLLTKNPALLTRPEYTDALLALNQQVGGRLVIEVSLAFWREEIAAAYDPGAPPVARRRQAIGALRAAGLPVVLRISPTYPLGIPPPGPSTSSACPQTLEDMGQLACFAAEAGITAIVHTPAKIVRPKHGPLHPLMQAMLALYRRLAGPEGLDFHGGAWRLPRPVAERYVVQPLRQICRRHGVRLEFCMHHLLAAR